MDNLEIDYKKLNDNELKSDMDGMLENMEDKLNVI